MASASGGQDDTLTMDCLGEAFPGLHLFGFSTEAPFFAEKEICSFFDIGKPVIVSFFAGVHPQAPEVRRPLTALRFPTSKKSSTKAKKRMMMRVIAAEDVLRLLQEAGRWSSAEVEGAAEASSGWLVWCRSEEDFRRGVEAALEDGDGDGEPPPRKRSHVGAGGGGATQNSSAVRGRGVGHLDPAFLSPVDNAGGGGSQQQPVEEEGRDEGMGVFTEEEELYPPQPLVCVAAMRQAEGGGARPPGVIVPTVTVAEVQPQQQEPQQQRKQQQQEMQEQEEGEVQVQTLSQEECLQRRGVAVGAGVSPPRRSFQRPPSPLWRTYHEYQPMVLLPGDGSSTEQQHRAPLGLRRRSAHRSSGGSPLSDPSSGSSSSPPSLSPAQGGGSRRRRRKQSGKRPGAPPLEAHHHHGESGRGRLLALLQELLLRGGEGQGTQEEAQGEPRPRHSRGMEVVEGAAEGERDAEAEGQGKAGKGEKEEEEEESAQEPPSVVATVGVPGRVEELRCMVERLQTCLDADRLLKSGELDWVDPQVLHRTARDLVQHALRQWAL